MASIEAHIYSEVLAMDTEVNIILPQEKQPYQGNGRFRVLWLLHGGSGDATAWQRMSAIERYAVQYGIAVVMPGGMYSCFTDMAHGGRFFTYLTEELPGIVRSMFPRLSPAREENYISGFSNGGYGCLKAGLSRPDLYGAIGAFSAGDKADVPFANDGSRRSLDRIAVFGGGSLEGTDFDLKHLGRKSLARGGSLPRVYHACGSEDPWLVLNHKVRDFFGGLDGNPYDYQYHEAEGMGHAWEFWETELLRFFEALGLEEADGAYITGI